MDFQAMQAARNLVCLFFFLPNALPRLPIQAHLALFNFDDDQVNFLESEASSLSLSDEVMLASLSTQLQRIVHFVHTSRSTQALSPRIFIPI
jgi:hypothetical protein